MPENLSEGDELLRGHKGTVVVMVDILVYGANKEEPNRKLSKVLQTNKES